jgi:hypothetical protein
MGFGSICSDMFDEQFWFGMLFDLKLENICECVIKTYFERSTVLNQLNVVCLKLKNICKCVIRLTKKEVTF